MLRIQGKKPVALIPIGVAFLVLALLWPNFKPSTGVLAHSSDMIRGLLFGVGIGLNALSVILAVRERQRG